MLLCICTGRQFEDTFENSLWRKTYKCNQCDFASVQADNLRTHLKSHLRKAYKCNKCDFASVRADNLRRHLKKHTNATNATLHLYRQAIWGHIWKLTLEKNIQIQSMRLCICSGRQFKETVEKNVQMQPFVTLHLFMQAIWENIWKLPQVKSRSNAINATFHLFRQAIWENIWKLPQVKSLSNAINAIFHPFRQKKTFEYLLRWKSVKMQPMRLCIFSSRQFEETVEKSVQMQLMQLCIFSGR